MLTLGKKKVHKLRLSFDDLMAGSEGKKSKSASAVKRRRSPSPAGSGSGKSTGTPATSSKKKGMRPSALGKKFRGEEEGEDLTRDMDDPPSDTNLREVEVPKAAVPAGTTSTTNIKKDADWLPTKGITRTL